MIAYWKKKKKEQKKERKVNMQSEEGKTVSQLSWRNNLAIELAERQYFGDNFIQNSHENLLQGSSFYYKTSWLGNKDKSQNSWKKKEKSYMSITTWSFPSASSMLPLKKNGGIKPDALATHK